MPEQNKPLFEIKKNVISSLSPKTLERINNETSDEPFKWNINSALMFTVIFSQLLTWSYEFYTTGDYTKLWIFLLAMGSGYCVYMLSIVIGGYLFFKLRLVTGGNLTSQEQMLAANSLLQSSKQDSKGFSYSSHHIKGEKDSTGFVFVVSSDDIKQEAQNADNQKELMLAKKVRNILIELHTSASNREQGGE